VTYSDIAVSWWHYKYRLVSYVRQTKINESDELFCSYPSLTIHQCINVKFEIVEKWD